MLRTKTVGAKGELVNAIRYNRNGQSRFLARTARKRLETTRVPQSLRSGMGVQEPSLLVPSYWKLAVKDTFKTCASLSAVPKAHQAEMELSIFCARREPVALVLIHEAAADVWPSLSRGFVRTKHKFVQGGSTVVGTTHRCRPFPRNDQTRYRNGVHS